MEYRTLGRTGVQVSPLCLGCMNFGGKTDEADSVAIIHRALDAGINFVDTANVYNRGISEEFTGKALKGRRDNVVLATKVHGGMGEDPNMRGNSRRHIIQQCDASLKRLQTDCIDLYQIHRPQPHVPIDETLRALDDLITAGKVHYVGTSTFASWQIVEALYVARELGLNRFVCEQPPYHLLDRRIERELVPMAQTYGLGLIPWSPLAGGMLTGKYRRGQEPPENARLSGQHHRAGQRDSDAVHAVVDVLCDLAGEKGCTPSQLALAWCKEQPAITSPIIGPRTMEQLEDNLGALEVQVSDEDCQRFDAVISPGDMVWPYYKANWGPHPHRV